MYRRKNAQTKICGRNSADEKLSDENLLDEKASWNPPGGPAGTGRPDLCVIHLSVTLVCHRCRADSAGHAVAVRRSVQWAQHGTGRLTDPACAHWVRGSYIHKAPAAQMSRGLPPVNHTFPYRVGLGGHLVHGVAQPTSSVSSLSHQGSPKTPFSATVYLCTNFTGSVLCRGLETKDTPSEACRHSVLAGGRTFWSTQKLQKNVRHPAIP